MKPEMLEAPTGESQSTAALKVFSRIAVRRFLEVSPRGETSRIFFVACLVSGAGLSQPRAFSLANNSLVSLKSDDTRSVRQRPSRYSGGTLGFSNP